ncbi:MAG: LPS assembly lipoprotein LptE [Pseudomonadota bacterium]
MSLFNRRALLTVALVLAACGFEPVYSPGGAGRTLQNAILVAEPSDRETYLLVRRIEERLGRPNPPQYVLSLNLTTQTQGLEIDPAGNTNRFNLIGTAGYILTDSATGDEVSSGTVNRFTSYSATDSTVATLASERDAVERLMVILADLIVQRLLIVDV